MIPREAVGEICVLVFGCDLTSVFHFGAVRVEKRMLVRGNQDKKRKLSAAARTSDIRWIVRDGTFPENFFLNTPAVDIESVFSLPTGQQRVRELFRRVHGRQIPRTVLETVAQQVGARERARDAKKALREEGIEIFTSRDNALLKRLG